MFNILELAFHKDKADKNNIRVKEQQKQYEYYIGDSHNIKEHLTNALEITYDVDDVKEMQLQWVNITEKIINQMSVVYSQPATRKIMVNGNEDESLTEYYLGKMPVNLNTLDKEAHRLAKLHNTSLPHVTYDDRVNRFLYRVQPSYLYDIKHEHGVLTELSYEKYFNDEWFAVFWTNEDHYRIDASGNRSPLPGSNDETNPFGIIPFPVFRLKNSIDFWGEGQSDVINVNEQINLLLTKLINRDIILGTEGTLLAINLDLYKKGEEDNGIKKIRAGITHPIAVDESRPDQAQPSLQHITTNPEIQNVRDTIDWYIRTIANFNGLNPSVILSQVKDTSDFQKMMDAVEQMEIRRDDLEPCRVFEDERFEITKIINNTLVGTAQGEGLKTIPEEASLVVDFAEIEVGKTPKDQREERDWKLGKNLTNLVEILQEENPDLTDEQAKEIINNNRTANGILNNKAGRFEQLLGDQNA